MRSHAYDPNCYLCPGNTRAGGVKNPAYTSTFAFNNDYPALIAETADVCVRESELLVARSEPGVSRVVCFSPRHDLTIPRMKLAEIRNVVDVWAEEYALARFSTRGLIMWRSSRIVAR